MSSERADIDDVHDAANASGSTPILSLVLPTTGNRQAVERCLGSVTRHASKKLLRHSELIVYLNYRDDLKPDIVEIRAYCVELERVFGSVSFLISPEFQGTAEESALAASRHASGKYLWICGDRRIFLPEGIAKLEQFVLAGVSDCAYFNSIWFDRQGKSSGQYSTFFYMPQVEMSYAAFVQHNGVNFIATGFGAWVIRRELLHLDVWREIIVRGGPHFSHVFFYLDQIGSRTIKCFSIFLFVLEAKIYHSGDGSEWDRYAKVHSSYRFFPWTLGLVRKYRVLFERGTFTPQRVRRSMCCERTILTRQIDEILRNLVNQLALAISTRDERLSLAEFNEILSFCKEVAPESLIVCDFLVALFEQIQSPTSSIKEKRATLRMLATAVNQDGETTPLFTNIVAQVGNYYVRLHPAGYLYSAIDDMQRFLWAYRLLGGPVCCSDWAIVAELDDVPELPTQGQPFTFSLPLGRPPMTASGSRGWRSAVFSMIVILHDSVFGNVLLSILPRSWLNEMRKIARRVRGRSASI
jgi:hypothetical protein